ncbi:hypothetical protein GCM10009828_099710 [Actinoplanes couchii]|uniref:Uncharacterized protein n=1 Tax=Actinoplanes couchii TaxID=403638 RepID=A0ABQ3XPW3_9ACTN|nr:hypothetical protein Aco03nite_089190 [Actinoplanes couchii]
MAAVAGEQRPVPHQRRVPPGDELGESVVVHRSPIPKISRSSAIARSLIRTRPPSDENDPGRREQMRMHHRADSAVWRAAMRPQWWRDAGAEDIDRV